MLPLLLLLLLGAGPAPVAALCPAGCACELEDFPVRVNCARLGLAAWPANISDQVQELDVSGNALSALPGSLAHLPELRELRLADNQVSALPLGLLRGLRELRLLDLSGNRGLALAGLGAGTLARAPRLLQLNLSRTGVQDSSAAVDFLRSRSLQVLDLSGCQLHEAEGASLLAGLPALRHLNLSSNPLYEVRGLLGPELLTLDLRASGLDSLHPSALLQLPQLQSLDVSRNYGFAFMPGAGVQSTSLRELRAHHCAVWPCSLKAFPALQTADLRHNKLRALAERCFDNPALEELDLSSNALERVHATAFHGLPALRRVNLAGNQLRELHWAAFALSPALGALDVSRNPLTAVTNWSAPALAELRASRCEVTALRADSLALLPSLQLLDLSLNALEALPANLSSPGLRALDLSYCRLAGLGNDSFRALPSLKALNLTGNRLTQPPHAEFFASNRGLRDLRVRDNPWRCDCADDHFRRLVQRMLRWGGPAEAEVTSRAQCAAPEAAAGRAWLSACYEVWYPPPEKEASVRRYGMAMLASFSLIGGMLALVSVVRGRLRARRKQRQERRQEEIERAMGERERDLRRQLRAELRRSRTSRSDSDSDTEPWARPRARAERSASQLTQPPTYEEALLLSRSQQDLLQDALPGPAPKPGAKPGPTTQPTSSAESTPDTARGYDQGRSAVTPPPRRHTAGAKPAPTTQPTSSAESTPETARGYNQGRSDATADRRRESLREPGPSLGPAPPYSSGSSPGSSPGPTPPPSPVITTAGRSQNADAEDTTESPAR